MGNNAGAAVTESPFPLSLCLDSEKHLVSAAQANSGSTRARNTDTSSPLPPLRASLHTLMVTSDGESQPKVVISLAWRLRESEELYFIEIKLLHGYTQMYFILIPTNIVCNLSVVDKLVCNLIFMRFSYTLV